MSISYVIAKYVDDPGRNEPDNVGVIVYDGQRAIARFDGEDDRNKLDLRTIRYRIPASRTYKAWVTYWRRMLEEPQRLDPAFKESAPGSEAPIERLVGIGSPDFYLEHGGSVILDLDERPLEQAAQELYERLVRPPDPAVPKSLRQQSEDALKLAGAPMEDESRFKTDYTVEIDIKGMLINEEFSFAIQNGGWHYLQEIGFDYGRPRISRKEVMNTVVLFEHGDWDRDQLAVLYDQTAIGKGQHSLLELLMKFATTVDVAQPERAAEKLHERLGL